MNSWSEIQSDFPTSINLFEKTRESVHMVTSKVGPEIETELPSHILPEYEPSDDLPTYENAIKMPTDYIKSPCDEDFIVATTSTWGNVRSANDFFTEVSISKPNYWQKFLITIIILCSIGSLILFLLFF